MIVLASTLTYDPTPVVLGAFGLAGTAIGALAWGFRYMLTQIKPALDILADSNTKLVKATEKNTKATSSADRYLRERNGRDNEVHGQMVEQLKKLPAEMQKIAAGNVELYKKALEDSELNIKHGNVEKLVANNVEIPALSGGKS